MLTPVFITVSNTLHTLSYEKKLKLVIPKRGKGGAENLMWAGKILLIVF